MFYSQLSGNLENFDIQKTNFYNDFKMLLSFSNLFFRLRHCCPLDFR